MNYYLSADALRRAASIKDQIETLQSELRAILEGPPPVRGPNPGPKAPVSTPASAAPAKKPRRTKRKISPEARARMAAAAKARWARKRAGK